MKPPALVMRFPLRAACSASTDFRLRKTLQRLSARRPLVVLHRACQHDASARILRTQPARKVLIRLGETSNFTDREGNDVREAPHHSPR